ncbi:MAG: twin-arginine translocase TatA/TatE family subunit [Caulobacteraceae bacterium]
MGGLAPWHIILLAIVVLLVFGGRGKLSGLMGDAAKGVRAFRDGLKGDETPPPAPPPQPLPSAEADKDTIVR